GAPWLYGKRRRNRRSRRCTPLPRIIRHTFALRHTVGFHANAPFNFYAGDVCRIVVPLVSYGEMPNL
ncbi:MAG: hypothetical protein IJW46_03955, partial [Clostridia bacterium]|nr:hypothetical protein [Clostridia bacterium]